MEASLLKAELSRIRLATWGGREEVIGTLPLLVVPFHPASLRPTCLSTITMRNSIWKQIRYPECRPCQRAKNSNERPWESSLFPRNLSRLKK